MLDFLGSDEFWLNFTNIALGVTTLVCVVAIVRVMMKEIAERRRLNAFANSLADDHVFAIPGLGLTMADGGKRIEQDESTPGEVKNSRPGEQPSAKSDKSKDERNSSRSEN